LAVRNLGWDIGGGAAANVFFCTPDGNVRLSRQVAMERGERKKETESEENDRSKV
jgi:hypothetical protein